jgi:hypothetical protein
MLGLLTSAIFVIITSGKHDKRVAVTVYTRLPGEATPE